MAKTRRSYKGGAASTTITGTLTSNGTSFVIAAYTGWPYGSNPFFVVIEPGTANEEKILVTRSGATDTTVNVTTRGVDDTTAAQHAAGSAVYPVFTAIDADEANELAATMTTKGDLITHDTSTFARLAVGTNAHVLKADSSASTGLAWGQIATASIADDAVTAAKISAGAVAASELASDAVTTAKILDANVTAGKLATDSVTTAKIADSNVTTAKIADSAITEAKLGLTELKVRRTTSTTLTYNTGYSVVWNVEDADASGFISVSSSNITVPTGKAGLYSVGYTLTFDNPGDNYLIDAYLYLGGTYVRPNNYTTSFQPDGDKVYSGATVYLDASSLIYLDVTNKSVNQASLTMTSARLWLTRIMD